MDSKFNERIRMIKDYSKLPVISFPSSSLQLNQYFDDHIYHHHQNELENNDEDHMHEEDHTHDEDHTHEEDYMHDNDHPHSH